MGLTKRAIDAATYQGDGSSQDIRYDGKLPGFGLRIYPSGRKSFVLRYRNGGGRTRLVTLGRYGPVTLAEARKRASKLLGGVYAGEDPLEARERKRAESVTVVEFAERWLEDYAKPHRGTWREDKRRIENRIVPALGSRPLASVTPGDVAKLHAAIGREAPVEANRVIQLLRGIYNAALAWRALPRGHGNPAQVSRSPYGGPSEAVRTFREESRERFVRPDEMPGLLEAIGREEDPRVRVALRLILFTGCRKSEILRARWEDVDLKRGELRLPKAKSGSRTVQLSSAAIAELETLPRSGSPYLFPSPADSENPRSDVRRQWRRVRKRAGLEDVRLHDLRRTLGAWLANEGASELLIGKVLGHSDPAATRIYARLTDETSREALEDFAAAVNRTRLSAS